MLRNAARFLLRLLYRVEVRGTAHFTEAGARVLIVANHLSFLDAVLLSLFLPEPPVFAINTHIARRWWVKPLLLFVKTFPLDPTNPMAAKGIIHELKSDKKCVIFPEGRITVTGSLMKVYEGPGMIADKSGAMLLPVRIDGAQYTPFSRLKGKVRIRLFPKITLNILPPRRFDVPEELRGRKRRVVAGRRLYDLMAEMMFDTSPRHATLYASLLEARAIHGGGHLIAEDSDRQPLSYNALITRSLVLGKALRTITERAEMVGVLLPNAVGTLVTFFALQSQSRVPAMLNYSTGARNILAACEVARLKTVVTSRRFIALGKLEALAEAITGAGVRLVYLEDVRKEITWQDKLRGIVGSCFASRCYKREGIPQPEEPAVVLFTSGSEGVPKGVVLSHANIQANRYQLAARIDFGPTDKVFNALPMFHSFGLTGATLLPVLAGIRTFFYPNPLHYRIVPELVYDTNATLLFGTDTFLSGYVRFAHPYYFYSLRYVIAGA